MFGLLTGTADGSARPALGAEEGKPEPEAFVGSEQLLEFVPGHLFAVDDDAEIVFIRIERYPPLELVGEHGPLRHTRPAGLAPDDVAPCQGLPDLGSEFGEELRVVVRCAATSNSYPNSLPTSVARIARMGPLR